MSEPATRREGRYQFDLRPDGQVVVTAIAQGIPLDVFPLAGQTLSGAASAWLQEWGD